MVYIKIKENTAQGKLFAAYAKTLPFVEIVEENELTPKQRKEMLLKGFEEGLLQIKAGKAKKYKDLHGK
jgi:hypothetical protein